MQLTGSVGFRGINKKVDVKLVQKLLNEAMKVYSIFGHILRQELSSIINKDGSRDYQLQPDGISGKKLK